MFNLLKSLRYVIFLLFIICNSVITSVAVWNLSIIEADLAFSSFSAAKQVDAYLIFVGAAGLLLIFPVIFFELFGKNVFFLRVWFELLWVGLFFVMELAGAAAISAVGNSQLCAIKQGEVQIFAESPCASTQVLQAFTWLCCLLLLGYFILLAILSVAKHKEDPTIWHCAVRRFPWMKGVNALKSNPASPMQPAFRSQTPVIVAPRPRRIAALREAFLNYRSGLSLDYDIEHFQSPAETAPTLPVDRPIPPIPATTFNALPPIRLVSEQARQSQQPVFSSPFYHSSVQTAIERQPGPQPQAPPPAQLTHIRRLPPSPPPLGDWPRLDATARPRTKPKPLPQPLSQPERQLVPRPQPQPPRTGSYPVDAPSLSAALEPLASPTRSRPTGPRRRSSSIDDNRPPQLDLSNISSFRSRGFS